MHEWLVGCLVAKLDASMVGWLDGTELVCQHKTLMTNVKHIISFK